MQKTFKGKNFIKVEGKNGSGFSDKQLRKQLFKRFRKRTGGSFHGLDVLGASATEEVKEQDGKRRKKRPM